jgi:hypothetical protein
MTRTSDQPDTTLDPGPGLAKIRLRHNLLIGIFVIYIPAVSLLYFLQLPQMLILGSAVALIFLGSVVAFVIGLTSCPACGQLFHVRGMGGSIFTGACVHCGIALKQRHVRSGIDRSDMSG